MRVSTVLIAVALFLSTALRCRADDAPANGIQTPLAFEAKGCQSSVLVASLRRAFFTDGKGIEDGFSDILGHTPDCGARR
jgi:hypothetical protein